MTEVKDRDTIAMGGVTYIRSQEGHRGKKAVQVAEIIQALQEQDGQLVDFETLCNDIGIKWPQDIQAATIALELIEAVDLYHRASDTGKGKKIFYVWRSDVNPTPASSVL